MTQGLPKSWYAAATLTFTACGVVAFEPRVGVFVLACACGFALDGWCRAERRPAEQPQGVALKPASPYRSPGDAPEPRDLPPDDLARDLRSLERLPTVEEVEVIRAYGKWLSTSYSNMPEVSSGKRDEAWRHCVAALDAVVKQ